jgi:hypothetical protein
LVELASSGDGAYAGFGGIDKIIHVRIAVEAVEYIEVGFFLQGRIED